MFVSIVRAFRSFVRRVLFRAVLLDAAALISSAAPLKQVRANKNQQKADNILAGSRELKRASLFCDPIESILLTTPPPTSLVEYDILLNRMWAYLARAREESRRKAD